MRLDHWALVGSDFTTVSPEATTIRFRGRIFGRAIYRDGDTIHTSTITGADLQFNYQVATGISYQLGAVDPAYEKQYPNALDRLTKRLIPMPKHLKAS